MPARRCLPKKSQVTWADTAATHGIYERAALKRCQRKGARPPGWFRLPWARCQADAWDGVAWDFEPSLLDAVAEGVTRNFPTVRRGLGGEPFR